jgi:ABC-2 type transport system ATP-binding protein
MRASTSSSADTPRTSSGFARRTPPSSLELLAAPDVAVETIEPGFVEIAGLTAEQIGTEAAARGYVLYELTPQRVTLEDAFMDLTQDELEFKTHRPSEPTHEHEEVRV